ncbi:hypothetical protein CTAYLR_009383 [Chrysophaeum taylorii]|uniref:Uncharacterized protein n=1 Tax=Chrysophaeum taylorii TaxID=2483200 RepID=A0AAD7UKM7_9STRA|nr:hypothetical protein CTAYLR_009383 [Chrysophaeum taylorii]
MAELAKAAHSISVGTRVVLIAKEARPVVGAALFRLTTFACLGLLGYAVACARRKGVIELYSERALQEGVQRYCEDGVCVIASNRYERDLGRPNGLYHGIILGLFQEKRLEVNNAKSCEVSEELVVADWGGCQLDVMAIRAGNFRLSATTATGRIVEFELVGKYAEVRLQVQAIDERVVVSYWDYTIEDATRDCCFTESVLWSSDWFSTVNPKNTLNVVDSGRFAFPPIRKSTGVKVQNRNAYGLLTQFFGLGNVVDFPHFGCAKFREVFSGTRAYGLAMDVIATDLHSPVHGMIGGNKNYVPEIEADHDAFHAHIYNVSSASNAVAKKWWRMGIIECPKFCAPDTPAVNSPELETQCGWIFGLDLAGSPNT